MEVNRESENYKRGYSDGKALGSGLFNIGAIRRERENHRLSMQRAEEESEKLYHFAVREALQVRENEIVKKWQKGKSW